jgi:hypothetical protein
LLSSFAGRGEDGIEQDPIDEKDVRLRVRGLKTDRREEERGLF